MKCFSYLTLSLARAIAREKWPSFIYFGARFLSTEVANGCSVQNIDLWYVLQPIIVIIICSALMVYWHSRRHFHAGVWGYSAIAYFGAITLKYAVQLPTINTVTADFGAHSVQLGLYYGLQTVFFEVGLAYLVAWYAISHGKLEKKDAEAYGSGLAFWENAVYLGILTLISLISIYAILSTNTPTAQTVYNQLMTNQPDLFASASKALSSDALGTVERISSILFHFAWGYLCMMAAAYHKKRLFLIALPMGFVDFLVPFTTSETIVLFEATVFALSVISILVAWYATRRVIKNSGNQTILINHAKEASNQLVSAARQKLPEYENCSLNP
jgi:hypothetical protein